MFVLFSIVLVIVLNLLLSLFVLLRNPKSKTNQTFFLLAVALGFWAASNYATNLDADYSFQLLSNRVAFIAASSVIYVLWIFSRRFLTPLHDKKEFILATLLYAITVAVMLTPFGIKSVIYDDTRAVTDIQTGLLYWAYVMSVVTLFIYVLKNLIHKHKTGTATHKAQLNYILYGIALTFIWSLVTSAAVPAITGDWVIAKFGPIGALFLVGAITFSIVKHKLFDIRLVVARSVAYVLSIITFSAIYGVSIFGISALFFDAPNDVRISELTLYIVLAVFMAFTFQPLKVFFDRVTNKIFYKDAYDSQEVINRITDILASQIDMGIIAAGTLQAIMRTIKAKSGAIMVIDKGRVFKQYNYGQDKLDFTAEELQDFHDDVTVTEDLGTYSKKHNIMSKRGISVVVRLTAQGNTLGYLVLNEKQSGSIYSSQDLAIFRILSNELSVALENAKHFEEIKQFNITLQEKIKAATKELRSKNIKLKELDKAKDDFISMASHQLRTPLTTVKGYLSMVLEGDVGKVNKEQQRLINMAFGSAERMVYLITDLLNVSRLNTGKFVIDRKEFDLAEVVQSEVNQLQNHASNKQIELVYEKPKQPMVVHLDEGKLRQVIMNFTDNAIYYTPEGGKVEVKLTQTENSVEMRVVDNGIGVPKDQQHKLFTKFYRADNARQARPDGTGLGIFMAKKVIVAQGGALIFHSQEGKGSTFGFTFPLEMVKPPKGPTSASK